MRHLTTFDYPLLTQPLMLSRHTKLTAQRIDSFFLSFTDAFIYLIKSHNLSKKDSILLPDFYCPATVHTMEKYITVATYHINDDLQHDADSYISQINKVKPRIILNYSLNEFILTEEEKSLLASLSTDTIIIDDFAHRILTDKYVQPLIQNHYYIDSIRKYSPFLGSHLVNGSIKTRVVNLSTVSWHKLRIQLLQIIMDIMNVIAIKTKNISLSILSNELYMKQDDELSNISNPSKGDRLSFIGWQHLNLDAITKHRSKLVTCFYQELKGVQHIYLPKIKESYYGELIFFPMLVRRELRDDMIDCLKNHRIASESLWPLRDDVHVELNKDIFDRFLILPLTTNVSVDDVKRIATVIKQFDSEHHL